MPPPPRDPAPPDPPRDSTLGDDELTAYLDGELDPAAARAVEAKLANDLGARRQAEGLKKAFDLLDYLPRPEPSADFATRTITRLQPALSGKTPAVTAPDPRASAGVSSTPLPTTPSASALVRVPPSGWSARAVALWSIAAVVALGAGVLGHRATSALSRPAGGPPEDLAKNYRVLAHLPLYLGVDDLDFLKALDRTELFDPEIADAPGRPARQDADAATAPPDKLIEVFRGYPAARRQQLRQLDEELHALPAAERDHLLPVLENYALWLDRLPDAERREVLAPTAAAVRLEAVRDLHQRHWRESLPQARRDKLASAMSVDERLDLLRGWKADDRAKRDEWHAARRSWPANFAHTPWPFAEPGVRPQLDEYAKAVFKVDLAGAKPRDLPAAARLTPAEFAHLKAAHDAATKDGRWYVYGVALYRLAQQHPYLPEPQPGKPLVISVATLPADLPLKLRPLKTLDTPARGKWPEFALEVAKKAFAERVAVPEAFGPCRPADFTEPVRDFLAKVLLPKLTDAERDGLKKLEGKWPEYPQQMLALARLPKYDLAVPTVTLPGPPSLWARHYGSVAAKE